MQMLSTEKYTAPETGVIKQIPIFHLPHAVTLRHSGYVLHVKISPIHVSPVLHHISFSVHGTVT